MIADSRSSGGDELARKEAARDRLARELTVLAVSIRRFKVDTQRFLAGDLAQPPEELVASIRDELRRLQTHNLKGAAETFRLGTLEAQFNSHLGLYGRRLRERELGGVGSPKPDAQRPVSTKKVVIGGRDDRKAIETLYRGLYPDRQPSTRDFAFEKFGNRLMKQVAAIRTKTGCKEIAFRVAEQDGKPKLKARPIKSTKPKT